MDRLDLDLVRTACALQGEGDALRAASEEVAETGTVTAEQFQDLIRRTSAAHRLHVGSLVLMATFLERGR